MKIIITLALMGFASAALSQNTMFQTGQIRKISRAYLVTDASTQGVALFLSTRDTLFAYRFDNDLNQIAFLGLPFPDIKPNEFLGANGNHGLFKLYFADKSRLTCSVMEVNFNEKATRVATYSPTVEKGESFVYGGVINGKMYLFTALNGTSVLKYYAFNDVEAVESRRFDFGKNVFGVGSDSKLARVLSQNGLIYVDHHFNNLHPVSPARCKLFTDPGKLYLTVDGTMQGMTAVIEIDPATGDGNAQYYHHKAVGLPGEVKVSNSFIHNGHLFQLIVASKEGAFSISSLRDKKVKQSFEITGKRPIVFGNAKAPAPDNVARKGNELPDTKQFLRKATFGGSQVGITVHEAPNSLTILLGGYAPAVVGSLSPMGPSGTFLTGTPHELHYPFEATVSFHSILNADTFEHQAGEVVPTIYDRIRASCNEMYLDVNSETLLPLGDNYLYGYYNKSSKAYFLKKFPGDIASDQ